MELKDVATKVRAVILAAYYKTTICISKDAEVLVFSEDSIW